MRFVIIKKRYCNERGYGRKGGLTVTTTMVADELKIPIMTDGGLREEGLTGIS